MTGGYHRSRSSHSDRSAVSNNRRARVSFVPSSKPLPRCRRHRWAVGLLIAAAVCLRAFPAAAEMDVSIRPFDEAPVRLLRPSADEVLTGGAAATLAWQATSALTRSEIEEWEAFLSFDNGRHWPVRITPHLDVARSSFSFVVPPLPSNEIRIMLRFGDETREVGYVVPTVWRSTLGKRASLLPLSRTILSGESAHPGAPPSVLWVDGPRDGSSPVLRASTWQPTALETAYTARFPFMSLLFPPEKQTTGVIGCPPRNDRLVLRAVRAFQAVPAADSPGSLLRFLCRQNE